MAPKNYEVNMGSFIADPDGRNAFMQMATQAVKKADRKSVV